MDKEKLQRILKKAIPLESQKSLGIASEFINLEDKIDSGLNDLSSTIKEVKEDISSKFDEISETLKKKLELDWEIDREEIKGDDGYTPIKGIDYFDGKDYVLTAKDKKEIASQIKVPIVEKVIEKIERIEPIVTNEIVKEITEELSGEQIVERINDLPDDIQIDAKHIKNLPQGNKYYGGAGIKEIIAGDNITVDSSSYPFVKISSNGANVQPDWNQTDDTKDDYIKNKPIIITQAEAIAYSIAL